MTLSEHIDFIVARLQSLKDDPRYADIMSSCGINETNADQLKDLHRLVVDTSYVLDDLFGGFASMVALDDFNHEVSDKILKGLAWVIGPAAEEVFREGDH